MTTKEFIEDLGISVDDNPFKVDGDTYTLVLTDSDDYSELYALLSHVDSLDLDAESTVMTEHSNMMKYMSDDYDITLEANYDSDIYKFIVERVN